MGGSRGAGAGLDQFGLLVAPNRPPRRHRPGDLLDSLAPTERENMNNPSRFDRLLALRRQHESDGAEMALERGRFDALRETGPTVAVSAFNLFQTPPALAWRMAGMIPRGSRLLEPSAGLGRLIDAAQRRADPASIVAVEVAQACAGQIYANFPAVRLIQADFLACNLDRLAGPFDAVLMNPPFHRGADVQHIRHAAEMIRPGGLLVALCYNGVRQNAELNAWADTWEVLPPANFASEGTLAQAVLLTKTI